MLLGLSWHFEVTYHMKKFGKKRNLPIIWMSFQISKINYGLQGHSYAARTSR